MSILIALFRTHHKIVTDFDKDNNRSSHTILKVATTSRSNRISDKSRDRRGIDEGGHHCHEAISRAYNVRTLVPLRRYRRKGRDACEGYDTRRRTDEVGNVGCSLPEVDG